MKLIQRIGYYLGGFALGLIILAFFFNKKRTSCSYGPEARVIKNINSKKIRFSETIALSDSVLIKNILKNGDVNFLESDTRKEPCGLYLVEGVYNDKDVQLQVENCDSLVTVLWLKK